MRDDDTLHNNNQHLPAGAHLTGKEEIPVAWQHYNLQYIFAAHHTPQHCGQRKSGSIMRNPPTSSSKHQQRTKKLKTDSNRRLVKLSDFTFIQDPHPYGVLPGGNRFFGPSTMSEERLFHCDVWKQILSFVDGRTLGKLAQVSRYLYVASHQPELWRDLVLRSCESNKLAISEVGPSWKDTFVVLFPGAGGGHGNAYAGVVPISKHVPIPMPGLYSDEIYQSHLCRSFAIPKIWLDESVSDGNLDESSNNKNNSSTVPRVAAERLTAKEFFEHYEEPNQPVVVTGAAKGRAVDQWKDVRYLLRHNNKNGKTIPNNDDDHDDNKSNNKTRSFRTTSGAAPIPVNFHLKAYFDYCKFTYLEESPLYLFDRTAFTANETWYNDFFPEFYTRCPYWDPTNQYGHDLLQHLGPDQRPDHTWVIMGPKRSGSVFHIDPNATHAWNACIKGRKRWIFYPPGDPPPGIYPSEDGDEVALPLSVGEWIIQFWQQHIDQYRIRPKHKRPMECTTHAGDVVFVPHGWWHCVINLDDCNIAITHNYISPSNLGNALKFFVQKVDQVSGCRDREDSIKPEFLYDEFVKAMKIKEPTYLERALKQTTWTCNAWRERGLSDGDGNAIGQKTKKKTRKDGLANKDWDGENQNAGGNIRDPTVDNDEQKESIMSPMSKIGRMEQAFTFSFL
jgi:hypothetical protein